MPKRAEIKTKPTRASVRAYLAAVADPVRRADCLELDALMREVSGEEPVMWGESLVGYGSQVTRSAAGREVEWLKIGFAPRKGPISLYLTCNLDRYEDLLAELGPHRRGVGCLYVKRLDDVSRPVLRKLVRAGFRDAGKA